MEKIKLTVKAREAKTPNQLRREGQVPATLYGPGQDSESLQVEEREFGRLPVSAYSSMIELNLNGKSQPAVIRHVQRKSTTHKLQNIELYRVSMDRMLTMTVPLKFIGTSPAVAEGGVLVENYQEAEIESLPGDLPDFIEVDLGELKVIDDSLHFASLKLPAKVKLLNPPDEVVVKVVAPRAAEAEEAKPAAAEEGAAAAPAAEAAPAAG
ncbi:MAG TPA: 50S ribosomal protein L25 [Planktothrix sp.]